MNGVQPYTVTEPIAAGEGAITYRGRRGADGVEVLVKILHREHLDPRSVAKLRLEHMITRDLKLPGVLQSYDLVEYDGALGLVLEGFAGRPLQDLIRAERLDLGLTLEIAVSLSDAVESIHRQQLIHKHITPANVFVDPEARRVKLTGFGIATRLSQEPQRPESPDRLEGSLAYMAPEQTGRMNRSVDRRADLYSVGATLYEMLTGDPPFRATDPLELVHSHIARTPPSPREVSPEVPAVVSDIVMKLLAKNAEDRYRRAQGLKGDLQECLRQWGATGRVEPFPLGRQDHSDELRIPQKLYGREADQKTLLDAFERASRGAARLLLISGYAGVGKSALVHEIHKAIAQRGGYFVAGKFDQLGRNIPYVAVAYAFRELCRQLLTERPESLARWRRELAGAVGERGQVLIDVIPELALIIGPQPAAPELGPSESQNRFALVFQDFLRVFATEAHPLCIFLDDLQWADPASLRLLSLLLAGPESSHLLVIGAYRNNEVDAAHPLSAALGAIREAGAAVSGITLSPLSLPDVTRLCADALSCDLARAEPLAGLVFQKTLGNPFFVNQFLLALREGGHLTFDAAAGHFRWDLDRIRQATVTDNVVDLVAGKIRRLSPRTQGVLELAACIGHQFDLKTLSFINEKSLTETAAELWEALSEGLVLPMDAGYLFVGAIEGDGAASAPPWSPDVSYTFLHDRVQQAAYSLIEGGRKNDLHLRIGRLLLGKLGADPADEDLFNAVNHLNIGAAGVADGAERLSLARLNLAAATRSKARTAYQAAADYLRTGASLLDASCWESEHDLCFALHAERAECAYLSGAFDEAESLLDALLHRAKSDRERAQVYTLRMVFHSTLAQFGRAVAVGREALALFGIDLPEGEAELRAAVDAAVAEVRASLAHRRIDELADAGRLTDPDKLSALKLLVVLSVPAYIADPNRAFILIVAKQVDICLRYGHSELSSYAYMVYGWALAAFLDQYTEAYQFGRLALEIDERFHNVELACKLNFLFAGCINSFQRPLRTGLPYLRRARDAGLSSGDFPYLSYACNHILMNRLGLGDDLASVREEADACLALMQRTKDALCMAFQTVAKQMIANLTGLTRGRRTLTDDTFDEDDFAERVKGADFAFVGTWYSTVKLQLLFLHGDYEGALEKAIEAEQRIAGGVGHHFTTDLYFYASLTLLALCPGAADGDRARYLDVLAGHRAKLAAWAEACPENYLHKYLLVRAEEAGLADDDREALGLYDRALEAARENGFVHHEALASELCARFHLRRGRARLARGDIRDAYHGYLKWGATAKAADLAAEFPHLLNRPATPNDARGEQAPPAPGKAARAATAVDVRGEQLDMATVMRAAEAMAGEVRLDKVLDRLMRVVIENAGAQRGALVLERGGRLLIEATITVAPDRVQVGPAVPVDARGDELATTVIHYVARTREPVVLSDAASERRFAADPYIAARRPKSLMCLAMTHQGRLTGILYLENNAIQDAFSPARVQLWEMLSSQAAIAVENALLYAHVQEVTEQLRRSNDALRRANDDLDARVRARTAELEEAQRQLIETARAAGMAEVATNVLHNVGNVLNSVTICASIASDKVRGSRAAKVRLVAEMLGAHAGDLPGFLTQHEQGRALLPYLAALADGLDAERASVIAQLEELAGHIDHIRNIVRVQQQYAASASMLEGTSLPELLDDAVRINAAGIHRHGVEVVREVSDPVEIVLDRHRVLQILVNLVSNAVYALADSPASPRRLVLRATLAPEGVTIEVVDNGVGIPAESMPRIFRYGFSTRRDGHGFGLHSSALFAKTMGGSLAAHSDGEGKGATFTLKLPHTAQ